MGTCATALLLFILSVPVAYASETSAAPHAVTGTHGVVHVSATVHVRELRGTLDATRAESFTEPAAPATNAEDLPVVANAVEGW